jgi:acyl-CoA dehydrogenase
MLQSFRSAWMNEELELFRDAVRRFVKEHIEPNDIKWRKQHHADRDAWLKAGELGMILPDVPEEYGGGGGTPAHACVAFHEIAYSGNTALGLGLNHMVGHYILSSGTEAQKKRWLPGLASGEIVAAIAMTEPGTGSDLQAVRTRASRKDEKWVISGAKTFISNGQLCDMVVVVAKTDPTQGAKGISLIILDTKTPGFRRGKVLEKVGMGGQDTSEMFFDECEVPVDCVLGGQEGQGFYQLMANLPYERAQIAVNAVAAMERALELTVAYTKERKAFGRPILEFQNTRFALAELQATVLASRLFMDHIVQQWVDGRLDSALASMGKFWLTERQCEVIDRCVQFFGGNGYMMEFPIARLYADARVQMIYGGTNEIQRELVARSL